MREKIERTQFAVLGLGLFGMSVVRTLADYDVCVLACDHDPERLHEAAEYATHVVQADAADEGDMDKLGLGNFDVVVVAIGEDFEAAVMALMKAKELGVKYVVAKATGLRQRKIFESLGADLVVQPEDEMGAKIARRLVRPHILNFLEDTAHHQVTEMRPLPEWVGKTVREAAIRERQGMTLLAILRGATPIIPVRPNEVLRADDVLITLAEAGK